MESQPLKIQLTVPSDKSSQNRCTKPIAFLGISIWLAALFTVSYHCFENELSVFSSSVSKSFRKALDLDGQGESLLTAMHHTQSDAFGPAFQEPQTCSSQFEGSCSQKDFKDDVTATKRTEQYPQNVVIQPTESLRGVENDEKMLDRPLRAMNDPNGSESLNKKETDSSTEVDRTKKLVNQEDSISKPVVRKISAAATPISGKPKLETNAKFERTQKIPVNQQQRPSSKLKNIPKPSPRLVTTNFLKSPEQSTKADLKKQEIHTQSIKYKIPPEIKITPTVKENQHNEKLIQAFQNPESDTINADITLKKDDNLSPKEFQPLNSFNTLEAGVIISKTLATDPKSDPIKDNAVNSELNDHVNNDTTAEVSSSPQPGLQLQPSSNASWNDAILNVVTKTLETDSNTDTIDNFDSNLVYDDNNNIAAAEVTSSPPQESQPQPSSDAIISKNLIAEPSESNDYAINNEKHDLIASQQEPQPSESKKPVEQFSLNDESIVDSIPEFQIKQDSHSQSLIPPSKIVYNSGEIRSAVMDSCVDSGALEGSALSLYACHGAGGNQNWIHNIRKEIRKLDLCADHFGGPSVLLFKCHGNSGNQRWIYDATKQTFYHPNSNTCLTLLDEKNIGMEPCDEQNEKQKWIWKHTEGLNG